MKCDICVLLTYLLRILCYLKENNDDKDDDDHDTGVQELKHYHWSYHGESGPLHWYKNFFHCGGRRQSPINIITSEVEPVTWLSQFQFTGYEKISGQGRPVFMTLRNNGHTASMAIQDDIYIQGSNLRDRFQMAEIHFHWGEDSRHGSEHSIDGSQSPLEMHFVHFNTKYGNLSKAMLQPDGLAVIGVFAKVVPQDNPAFDHISQAVSNISLYDAKTKVTGIRPTDLLPGDTTKYFHYLGSLTTPPCYESVLWYVMAEKYRVSQRQINRFKRLRQQLHQVNSTATPHSQTGSVQNHNRHGHSTHSAGSKHERDKYILSNFRPSQPLNRRTVFCSHPLLRSNQPSVPNNYQADHPPATNFRMGPQSVRPAAPNSLVRESFGKRLNNNNGNRFLDMGATNTNSANRNNINGFNKLEIRFGGDAGMKKHKLAQGKTTYTTQKATAKSTYPGQKTTQRSPLSLLDKVTNSYSLFSDKFLHGKFKVDKDALLKTFATLLIQQTKQLALSNQRKSFQNPSGIREFSNPLMGRMKTQTQQSSALRIQNRIPGAVSPTTPNNNKIPQLYNQAPVKSAQTVVTTPKPITNTSPHTTVTTKPTPPTRKPWVDPEMFPTLPNGVLNNSLPSSLPLVLVTQKHSQAPHLLQVQSTKIPPTAVEPHLQQGQNTIPVNPHLQQVQSTKKPPTPVDPHIKGVQNTNISLNPIAPYIQQVQNANIPPTPIQTHLQQVQNTNMPPTPAEPYLHHVQNKNIPPNSVEPYLRHIQNPNTAAPEKIIIQHFPNPKIPPTPVEPYFNVPNAKMPPTPVEPYLNVPNAKLPPNPVEPYLNVPNAKLPPTPVEPYLNVPNAKLPPSPVDPYLNVPNAKLPPTPVEPYLNVPNAKLPPTPVEPYLNVPNEKLPSTPVDPYLQHGQHANIPQTLFEPFLQEVQNTKTFTPAVAVTTTIEPLNNQDKIPLQNVKVVLPEPATNSTLQPLHDVIQPAYQKLVPKNENLPEGGGINAVTKADLQIITQAFESQHSDGRVPITRQQNDQQWNEHKYVNNPFPSNMPSLSQNMQNEFNNFIENQNPNVAPTMEHSFTLPEKSAFRTNERPYRWEISTVPPHVRKWMEHAQSNSNPTPPPMKGSEPTPPSPPTAPPTPPPPRDYVMQYHLGFFNPMKRHGGPILSPPSSPQTETTDQSWPRENSRRGLSSGGGSLSMMSQSDIFPDGTVPNHWPSDPRASRRQEQRDTRPDV